MTRSSIATPGAFAPPAPAGWTSCPACGWLLYRKRLERDLHVCPECDEHLRLSARARIDLLVDGGSFTETVFPRREADPLSFTDVRPYPDRQRDAGHRSGESEAVLVGAARIGGVPPGGGGQGLGLLRRGPGG